MYTFIALSDIHLGWKLFNLPELAQDLKDCFRRACDVALEKKVDYVFIVGDLYDTNRPPPDLVQFVAEQAARLKANGITVAGIAGDHDKPVNGSAWIHLSGIMRLHQADWNGAFIGYDYNDDSSTLIEKIKNLDEEDKRAAEWIFLHGQVPELFSYTEDKKKLDIKSLDTINEFPNLKGVILGDIHMPLSGLIEDPKQERPPQWIGYCGSLGVIKTDEIEHKAGILYWNGSELSRIPFKQDREYIRLNLGDSLKPINWIEKYKLFFQEHKGKKPLFIIEHDKHSKELLPEVAPLYEVGIVRVSTTRASKDRKEEVETINIRSELKTNNRIEGTLKECAQEQEVYDLILGMLTDEDPKSVIDKYKLEAFK